MNAASTSVSCGPSSGPLPSTPRRYAAAAAVRPLPRHANPPSSQYRGSPSGPFTTRTPVRSVVSRQAGVGRLVSNCLGSVFALVIESSQALPDPRKPLSVRKRRIRAVIQHHRRRSGQDGPRSSRRLSAPAFACWVVLFPLRTSVFPHGRPTRAPHLRLDLNGVATFRGCETRRGGPLLYPGAAVSYATGITTPPGRFPAASPFTPAVTPACEGAFDETSTGRFNSVDPADLSLRPYLPDGTGSLRLFPRASHPAVTSDACPGGDRSHGH